MSTTTAVSSAETSLRHSALAFSLGGTPFDPSAYIRNEWRFWRGPSRGDGMEGAVEQDERNLVVTTIDWSTVMFETSLRDGEIAISGEEKLRRLKRTGKILLGVKIVEDLFADYRANQADSVLEWLRTVRGITYLAPFGTILRCPAGGRYILPLAYDDHHREWDWGGFWLGCECGAACTTPVLESAG